MPTAGLKAEEVAISHRPAAGGTSSTGKQRLGQLAGWGSFHAFLRQWPGWEGDFWGCGTRATARRRFFLRHAAGVVRSAWSMLRVEGRQRKFLRMARGCGGDEVVVMFGMGMLKGEVV